MALARSPSQQTSPPLPLRPRWLRRTLRAGGRLLRYGWAAPASLVGLGAAAIVLLAGGRACVVDGVLEVSGGGAFRALVRAPWPWRFDAITLGHVVLGVDAATLADCRCHERVHVRQYERWGAMFFVAYAASSVVQQLRGGDPYRDNRFEREAFAAEAGGPAE
jgi:hypothetical protein